MDAQHRTTDDELSLARMKRLSPRRKSTQAVDLDGLVSEQLTHFGIAADTPYGEALAHCARRIYEAQLDMEHLWRVTMETIDSLDRADRIAYFNAKKFLCFQLAKVLDTLQNPSRRTYQSLRYAP